MNFFLVSLLLLSLGAVNASNHPDDDEYDVFDETTGLPSPCRKAAKWFAKKKGVSVEKFPETCTVWKTDGDVLLENITLRKDKTTIQCPYIRISDKGVLMIKKYELDSLQGDCKVHRNTNDFGTVNPLDPFDNVTTDRNLFTTDFPDNCEKAANYVITVEHGSIQKLKSCAVWKNEDKVELDIIYITERGNKKETHHCPKAKFLRKNNMYRAEQVGCNVYEGIKTDL